MTKHTNGVLSQIKDGIAIWALHTKESHKYGEEKTSNFEAKDSLSLELEDDLSKALAVFKKDF